MAVVASNGLPSTRHFGQRGHGPSGRWRATWPTGSISLYGQAFAAVYVQPGARVAVHLEQPIAIDHDAQGSRVNHREAYASDLIDLLSCSPPPLAGCATSSEMPPGEHTMLDIWYTRLAAGYSGRGQAGCPAARRTPGTCASPLTYADTSRRPARRPTPARQRTIQRQSYRLPNLICHVRLRQSTGTDPVPVRLQHRLLLYQRVQYAMPGERPEDHYGLEIAVAASPGPRPVQADTAGTPYVARPHAHGIEAPGDAPGFSIIGDPRRRSTTRRSTTWRRPRRPAALNEHLPASRSMLLEDG